ncbi:hypothetical protein [Sphingobacterium alkalisoli]|nr:hypothetical protein [Sphingobacterium alkalisoli]
MTIDKIPEVTAMTEQEIIKIISKIEGLAGMTVNERLFVCGLMD